MTFKCCKNCIIDIICQTPCEKFEVDDLQLSDLSDFNKCLLLINKYNEKTFKIDNEISVKVMFPSMAVYKNGQLHRDDGPAVIDEDGYKAWFKNGNLHRVDGPAIIYTNGDKSWYKNGVKIK